MDTQEVFNIVQFTMPMYTALICGLLLSRMYYKDESPLGRKNIKWAICAYALSVFSWFSITLDIVFPTAFTILNPFVLSLFMVTHMIYYRFVFEITRIYNDEKFPVVHYLIPALGFILMIAWSFFVPLGVHVGSYGVWPENYKFYSMFFTSKPLLFFIYVIVYAFFGLRRTMHFRKVVINYSADEQRISLVWLYQFLFTMLAALPMTVAILFLPKYFLISSGIALLPVVIAMLKDIILVHNVLLENYVIIKSDTPQLQKYQMQELLSKPIIQNDICKLETYMRKNKPYLNPRLKITDMITDLNTNRTSLSLLINRTYGMNFSRYINRYRLEELERIKSDSGYAGLCELDMVALAGFSDYRGYKRVKQREEIEI